jgi:hypothetical protein
MRGGEQRGENDQSVTQTVRVNGRRELDSVGVSGRVCERMTKSVTVGKTHWHLGDPPDNPLMVGDGMAGSQLTIIRETRHCWFGSLGKQFVRLAGGSQSVRRSEEAGKDRGTKGHRKVAAWRSERRK